MNFGQRKLTVLLLSLALFSIALAIPTPDEIGLTSSLVSSNQSIVAGGRLYIKVHFDANNTGVDSYTSLTSSTLTNPLATHHNEIAIRWFNGADPNTSTAISGANYAFTPTTVDMVNQIVVGYTDLPASPPSGAHSFIIRCALQYVEDVNLDDAAGNRRASYIAWSDAGISSTPAAPYTNSYMTITSLSATPTLFTPASYWQNGRNNNTIRVDFTTASAAPASNDTLSFISGSTVVQQIVFTNAISSGTLYAGRLTYSSGANGGLGGFTAVAADADTSGATTFTFAEPALGTRAALTNGSTYTVKLSHCESGAASATASFASFVYDNVATAPTLGYPIASFQGGHDDDSIRIRFTLPENARANSVKVEFRIGGNAAQQIIMSNSASGTYSGRFAYDYTVNPGSFSVVPGSQLNSDVIAAIYDQTNTTDLVDGSTYTVRVYYTDIAGNQSSNTDFASFVYDLTTLPATLSSPASNANLSLASETFQWNNTEAYTVDTLFFEKVAGPTDNNSPHFLAIAPNNALMNMSNPKSLTADLSNLVSTGNYTVGPSEGLSLVSGVTYRWYFKSTDMVTGNTVGTSANRQFTIASGSVLSVSANGLNTSINRNITNRPVLRLTGSTVTGAVDLMQLQVSYSGNVANTEISSVDLWYSAASTFAPGTSTHLATSSYNGTSSTFTGWALGDAHFTSGVDYLYLTISTTASATTGHHLTVTIANAGKFSFANGGDAATGTFPITTSSIGLPVELNRLSADSRNGIVYLHWVTESEVNNAGFEVLRRLSNDGEFQSVASFTQNADLRSKSDNGTSATPNEYNFVDNTVVPGTSYEYRLRSVDLDGIAQELALTVNVTASELPQQFALEQAYPNPFNSSTNVRFDVPFTSNIRIAIYDVNGREITRLVDGQVGAGNHEVMWNGRASNGSKVASGAYFVRLSSGKVNTTRKIVLLQ